MQNDLAVVTSTSLDQTAVLSKSSPLAVVAVAPIGHSLHYLIPDGYDPNKLIGCKVRIPLGRREAEGFVTAVEQSRESQAQENLKPLVVNSQPIPCLLPEQFRFLEWLAQYYAEPISSVLDLAVPRHPPLVKDHLVTLVNSSAQLKGASQKLIVEALKKNGGTSSLSTLKSEIKGASAVARKLEKDGIVTIEEFSQAPKVLPTADGSKNSSKMPLSATQEAAAQAIRKSIDNNEFIPYLLHGVTGSGKTEVYIDAVSHALSYGKGVIVLVPEIALTPQLIDRFVSRLNDKVAVLHSGMTLKERWSSWQALLSGEIRIAIGARSAIFAPVQNLGLIIVDEEHDGSFKQSEGIRYQARDAAIVRAKLSSAPVVLGSATPSLETYSKAKSGAYKLLELPLRHTTAARTELHVVDLNKLKPWELASPNISPLLKQTIEKALERKEQSFLLFNRRGFASFLQCDGCGAAVECPHCSVTLTYYQYRHSLLCHYCGFSTPPPVLCSSCGISHSPVVEEKPDKSTTRVGPFAQRGAGTERIVDEVTQLFPTARIVRLDRDAATTFTDYRNTLDAVRNGEFDIVVGTQLIAKGHDLPNVSVVGIIDCDIGLHMPDFRSAERTFQLLTQAVGRAGRREKQGFAVLQTRMPTHQSITMTKQSDYSGFATNELSARQLMDYPPYTRLLRVVVSATDKNHASATILAICNSATHFTTAKSIEAKILGPAPAPLERVRTLWRFHLLIKCRSAPLLNQLATYLRSNIKTNAKARVVYDIDPQDML